MTITTITIEHEHKIELGHADDRTQKKMLMDYFKKLGCGSASAKVTVKCDNKEAPKPVKKETVLKKVSKAVKKKK